MADVVDVRPQLFARNETNKTVTFNNYNRTVHWELPPPPNPDSVGPLPWEVAVSGGFDRLWDSGAITVAYDRDFTYVLQELPTGAGIYYRPHVHLQSVPQSVVDVQHNLGRIGPVQVVLTSVDGDVEYFNVDVEPLDFNTCRISLDDPVPFLATIF